MTEIVCVADLHEHFVDIPECDLLLVAGDVSFAVKGDLAAKQAFLRGPFKQWLDDMPARDVVLVAGNHDQSIEARGMPDGLRCRYPTDTGRYELGATEIINASHVDNDYRPVNASSASSCSHVAQGGEFHDRLCLRRWQTLRFSATLARISKVPLLANSRPGEDELVDEAIAWLRNTLPASWQVDRSQRTVSGSTEPAGVLDAAIDVRTSDGTWATLAVEARRTFSPRDVELLLSGLARSLLALAGHIPVLVVAPWLSTRTQEILAAERINYVDLTGNARIQLDNPALYLQSTGAQRNPAPAPRGEVRLRGPKAGRLVRVLADVRPPYGVREIAAAAQLNPGYVSRLLDTLDREALVERDRRGPVRAVDVSGLLRRWAQSYDVFSSNAAMGFLAPAGTRATLDRLADGCADRVAVTGSFAAVRHAPVAASAFLVAYCDDPAALARELELLPADTGANIALLRAFDPIVWSQTEQDDGITYAGVSQVAVDCLTGNGRMPAEGEALLGWMSENETQWRADSLDDLAPLGEIA